MLSRKGAADNKTLLKVIVQKRASGHSYRWGRGSAEKRMGLPQGPNQDVCDSEGGCQATAER